MSTSRTLSSLIACALLAGTASLAVAAGEDTLADCVTLSPDHEGARFGMQYLAIHDGDAHYRLEFDGSCSALNSGAVVIATRKEHNRLCPTGSSVSSRAGYCRVRAVKRIDADEFARYARSGRR